MVEAITRLLLVKSSLAENSHIARFLLQHIAVGEFVGGAIVINAFGNILATGRSSTPGAIDIIRFEDEFAPTVINPDMESLNLNPDQGKLIIHQVIIRGEHVRNEQAARAIIRNNQVGTQHTGIIGNRHRIGSRLADGDGGRCFTR